MSFARIALLLFDLVKPHLSDIVHYINLHYYLLVFIMEYLLIKHYNLFARLDFVACLRHTYL